MLNSSLSMNTDQVWAWGFIPILVGTVPGTVGLSNPLPPCLCHRLHWKTLVEDGFSII